MKEPRITTIIPTYRRPRLLERAIRSVLDQTHPHLQVCVYDNASGDETREVVAQIGTEDPRVQYHCHKENIGAIPNFNFGMSEVKTRFFSMLSDDNVLLPEFYEEALHKLELYPNAILFAGQVIRQNETGTRIGGSLDKWPAGLIHPPDAFVNIMEKGIPNWESVLFRCEVITKIGKRNSAYSGAADQDFMMRIAREHSIYVSKKPCSIFVFHKESWSMNRDLEEMVRMHYQRMEPWYRDEGLSPEVKRRLRRSSQIKMKHLISQFIYHRAIVGDDLSVLDSAKNIMRKDLDFSFKLYFQVILARSFRYHRYVRKLLARSIQWYQFTKQRFI